MKTNVLLVAVGILVGFSTLGSSCVNEGFLVSVNLEPPGVCCAVNPGNGAWNSTSNPDSINNLIPLDWRGRVRGFRLYDIRIRAAGTVPTGNVAGFLSYRLDNGTMTPLLSFSGPYSTFAGSVSLLNPQGLIIYNQAALAALGAAMNSTPRPQTITLHSEGSGPPVQQGLQICIDVYFQADASSD